MMSINGNRMTSGPLIDQIGRTAMVRLTRLGDKLRQPIFGKCEFLNPGGSVKDRIAKAIVEDADVRGQLRPGDTIIEATAGNTGLGLVLMAAARGYRLKCVMPEKMSHDKRAALAAVGTEVIMTANAPPSDPQHFQNVARRLSSEQGWFLADQFENPANPHIHETTTGPEIVEQCDGHVGAFVAGAGTGGTLTGVGRYMKRHCPGARIIMADPVGSRLAHLHDSRHPDLDAPYQVEGIGGSVVPKNLDLSVIDEAIRIDDETSIAITGRLWREEGLLVGASAGTAAAAALQLAQREDVNGPVVVLLPDSWDRYTTTTWYRRLAGV
jgi:cysteine synthase